MRLPCILGAMQRVLASETTKHIGKEVSLFGWVAARRDHGKLVFIDLRDRSGIVQIVFGEEAGQLHPEDVLGVRGTVQKRPDNLINPNLETGTIEVKAKDLKILSPAESLPFDLGQKDLQVNINTLLDNRSLTLRHPKNQAIFKIQEALVQSFRETLSEHSFREIFVPTIVPTATEGGAEVFKLSYYEHDAYLSQSPQLYKQIMVSVFERVFTVAHAYRAEPSFTTRHLTEYVSLDCEMGFIQSWEDLMDTCEEVVQKFVATLKSKGKKELEMFNVTLPKIPKKIPRLKLSEAQETINKDVGEPDLSPEGEREICKWAHDVKDSDFVFITHYPVSKRPFYTYPDPENKDLTLSFDMLFRGLECVTGGQRINEHQELLAAIEKTGSDAKNFEIYLQAFRFGMPPEGGFAMGLERLTGQFLGLGSVKEASLFPRDPERIDLRLSEIEKT